MKIIITLALLAVVQACPNDQNAFVFAEDLIPKLNLIPISDSQDEGAEDVSIEGRLTAGSVAEHGQFPWHVAVAIDGTYFCGGSIISSNWVLTSGNCVYDASTFRMIFGSTSPNGGEFGTVMKISREKVVHAEYEPSTHLNDIGLIEIGTPLTWSAYVAAIRLPAKSDVSNLYVGDTARFSGWGWITDNPTAISPDLMFLDVTVITNSECEGAYLSIIKDTNICTSIADGKSSCGGDSGGALAIQESDRLWTEVGIISFYSTNSCSSGNPTGYTRVTSYLSWIETNTGVTLRA